MNKLSLCLLLAVTLVSCSQQKFAFRKKLSVDPSEQQVVHRSPQNKPGIIEPQKGTQQVLKEKKFAPVNKRELTTTTDFPEEVSNPGPDARDA
jgi:hypothetical protein